MTVDTHTLALLLHPAEVLHEEASEVDPADPTVQAVAKRMITLMVEHGGAGLAAPQVGLSWRLFVTRNSEDADGAIVWINPTLEIVNGEVETKEEGCLSLPKIRGNVRRPVGIKITGWNALGEPAEMTSEEFIARVWQHENDHLDGILIIDKMSAMDRLVNRRAIRDLERSV